MKIIVDTKGGDNSASEFVKGGLIALQEHSDLELIYVGFKNEIIEALDGNKDPRISILDASEVVTNDDQPTSAIRNKKDSSLVKGLELLKSDAKSDAFVTSGNTGATLFGSMTKVGRMANVDRAALAPILPTQIPNKYTCLIDSGANVDCKPEQLGQFAIMGSCYMKSSFGIKNPTVALVSVGVEDKKGNEQTKEAFQILKTLPINFVGNMEAREALSGNYDVLVCDGFIGNVLLKSIEGTAMMVGGMLKHSLVKHMPADIDPTFLKKSFGEVMSLLDFNAHGGAPLLGVEKIVMKVHGASNHMAIAAAIRQVKQLLDGNLIETTKELISKVYS